MPALQGPDGHGASSAFLGAITYNPNGNALMKALCDGPMAVYRAVGAAVHIVDDGRRNLVLAGHHGFTARVHNFDTVPVEWDFPVTRVFHSAQAFFVKGNEVDEMFPLLSPGRALLDDGDHGERDPLDVTLVALPISYSGVLTAVCSVVVDHDSPWAWNDVNQVQGVCSAISLWQRIAHLNDRQVHLGTTTATARIREGGLTQRQKEIIELIRSGKSNASIAKSLGFSVGTVKAEVQALLALLSARDRKEIVVKADRAGISANGVHGA